MQTSVECKNNYFRKKSRNISWKEKKKTREDLLGKLFNE